MGTARIASSTASVVVAAAVGERELGFEDQGGLLALVSSFAGGEIVCGAPCGSQGAVSSAGGVWFSQDIFLYKTCLKQLIGRRKHLADGSVSRHSAQAAFEAACGKASTVRVHRPGGASLALIKVFPVPRRFCAAHHFGPTSRSNKGRGVKT